jgi:hypothetical protein
MRWCTSVRLCPPYRKTMAENAVAVTTLIFAAMAGIGSVIRCYQNERFWRWSRNGHRKKSRFSKRQQD